MPQKVWQVGEEVLAADFNTYVQNQTVPQFPNTAARDTWASPPNGAICVTTDTYTMWNRIGGAWTAVSVIVDSGSGVYPSTALVNGSAILATAPPVVAYPTRMHVVANGYAGCDSGTMTGIVLTIVTAVGGTQGTVTGVASAANLYGHSGNTASWTVAANASPNFNLQVNWTSSAGTTFVAANLTWWRRRT